MVKQASLQWNRLRRYLIADPGRFAGGSAVSDPDGLLILPTPASITRPGPG
jgi:hypothetical protein